MYLRITLFALLLQSLLFFPWWVSLLIALGYLFIFKAYEVIILGLIADSLFSVPTALLFEFTYVYTTLFIVMFMVTAVLKKYIIFY